MIRIPRNSLVLLIGPAGCGKSTFAAKHFKPTQVVSSDECRALISDDPADQTVSRAAFEILHHIVELRLDLGRLTVVDATSLTAESRSPLIRMARQRGFNTVAIVFDVELSTCLERNRARRRVVPDSAVSQQHWLLAEAARGVHRQRFDYLFVLNEEDQDRATVAIGRRISRPPGPRVR